MKWSLGVRGEGGAAHDEGAPRSPAPGAAPGQDAPGGHAVRPRELRLPRLHVSWSMLSKKLRTAAPVSGGTPPPAVQPRARRATSGPPSARSPRWSRHRRRPPRRSSVPASTLPTGRHPCRSGPSARGSAVSCSAWRTSIASAAVLVLWKTGRWASRPCPRTYLHRPRDRSRGPSLHGVVRRFTGTTAPSDSLLARRDFTLRAYTRRFARRGPPGRASPVPHRSFAACRRQYPGEVQRAFRIWRAVRGLRPDMTVSALPISFRMRI